MKLGVFIDNITDTENAVIAHILRFVKEVFCVIPVNWIAMRMIDRCLDKSIASEFIKSHFEKNV